MASETNSQKLLVGVDGSTEAANALRWAVALRGASDAPITTVMTWNYPVGLLMPVFGPPVIPVDFMSDSTAEKLAGIVDAVAGADTPSDQRVVMGSARSVLCNASEDHDVMVLGRTGRGRVERAWLGSTASYCVRHAECPVVIVGEATAPEKVVTVAVDGSPSSIEALVWALGLGDDHTVLAVHSHHDSQLVDLPLDSQFREDLAARADHMLADVVAAALERTGADESRVTRQVLIGDPRTTVVDNGDPDNLVVLGSHGHSGLARWVLGSLADYAVHHARGSVAIWR